MFKTAKTLALIILLSCSTPTFGSAQELITLNDLVERGKFYDGKMVIVEGEAIGEALKRGIFSWVNIYDKTNAMGIWLLFEDTKNITYYGDYKHHGDHIQIVGIFNRACPEHGGDMDIHAESIIIVKEGFIIERKLDKRKLMLTGVLIFCTLAFFVISRQTWKQHLKNSAETKRD